MEKIFKLIFRPINTQNTKQTVFDKFLNIVFYTIAGFIFGIIVSSSFAMTDNDLVSINDLINFLTGLFFSAIGFLILLDGFKKEDQGGIFETKEYKEYLFRKEGRALYTFREENRAYSVAAINSGMLIGIYLIRIDNVLLNSLLLILTVVFVSLSLFATDSFVDIANYFKKGAKK